MSASGQKSLVREHIAGNVFLVGMMGAGKTSMGKVLARRLNKTFLDCDHEIERLTGVKVAVIFEIEGETGFRQRETKTLAELVLHKDSVGSNTLAGPSIDTKQIITEVLVENGGTVVIGGIYTQTESSSTNKVPLLGDLPYVGFLFKQNLKVDNRGELLIFITPKIIKEGLTMRQ